MRDLERRPRLEGLFPPPDGDPPKLIRVLGGLLGDDGVHASIGGARLCAEPGEAEAQFRDRCLDEAALLGAPFVVVGGLPDDGDGAVIERPAAALDQPLDLIAMRPPAPPADAGEHVQQLDTGMQPLNRSEELLRLLTVLVGRRQQLRDSKP